MVRADVVLEDVGVGEAVQVQVHQRQADHVGRDVVALEVLREAAFFVRRQGAVALGVGVGLEDVLMPLQRNQSDHLDVARACNRFSSVMSHSIEHRTETTRDGWLTVRVATRAHGLVESRVSEVHQSRE